MANPLRKKETTEKLEPIALSIRDACQLLGISRSSLYREINAGRIKAVKSSNRTLITLCELHRWIDHLPFVESKNAK